MRTTLTLDDDLARELKERAHIQRRPLKDVINEVLRNGLSAGESRNHGERFVVVPNQSGLVSGVDPLRLNQLLDEMDATAASRER